MLSKLAISLFICITLFVASTHSQKGNIYLTPALGLQVPLVKHLSNNYTKAKLINNIAKPVPTFQINAEYFLQNDQSVNISYMNGLAGYSMGALSSKVQSTNGYNGTYSDRENLLTYNYRRLLLGYSFKRQLGNPTKPFNTALKFTAGIGIDFVSRENDSGIIIFPGTNRDGEVFVLLDSIYQKAKISFVIPLQISFETNFMKKRRLGLTLFYHIGLTRHLYADVNYVTQNYTQKARFKSLGSTYGFILSYPIKITKKSNS